MDLQIKVDDSKAQHFLAFLKDLDFVEVSLSKTKGKVEQKKRKEPSFTYFGSCPDWEMDADTLRYGGIEKRTKGW
ncbi:MAG: hypothetical protein K1X82_07365 [Bacteroidia bacterium]|nr:hypothetical protein [Bacteroidia bacterium]